MHETAEQLSRFDEYIHRLAQALRHKDRREPLRAYLTGLALPGERKSVEPMAAQVDPARVSSRHQSMHHFVAQADWSDDEVLRVARDYALSGMCSHGPIEGWLLDDTGIPKKGRHSVGVVNQYCGILGKNENCQVAVSVSLANEVPSIPAAYRLFLPEAWANDPLRRAKVGVPEEVQFAPKWKLALGLIDGLLQDGVPRACVGADAGYGDIFDFREGLTARGLSYVVGVKEHISVWPEGKAPLPPLSYKGRGQPPKLYRRTKDHQPVAGKALALSLPEERWREVSWREGSQGELKSRFAAVRVRPGHRDTRRTSLPDEEWLLIEWPKDEIEPTKYWLSTLPKGTSMTELVWRAKLRWRIERDYQELKSELGLDHFEGRGWRGFHHHASLVIATYAFLVAERARLFPPQPRVSVGFKAPAVPRGYRPRGAAGAG